MAFNKTKALEEAARLVSQRKLPEAIKRYLEIAEKDPEDLSLLNTTGDLCARAGNVPEALRQFNKLAATYSREGFTLKAIAIYKKIAKLDTQSADSFLKLAELYASQGLSHEAREQYKQALAFCQAHRLQEKTLQILTKLAALDPSTLALEKQGKTKPAAPEARLGSEPGSPEASKTESPVESTGASVDLRAPLPPEPAIEMDFSVEWQGFTSPQAAPPPQPVPAATDLGEEKREVQFYVDYGLFTEARTAIEALEKKYPGHPELMELRKHVEETMQPSRREAEAEPVSPSTQAESTDDDEDNPQTHYHLGVAFREMGLLDEAIGEFQKVVKGAGKGNFPPHFVEACSLLGLCFLEKGEPRIAAQWYLRACEAPDADEETSMALSYGLASAYEQLGDSKAALEKFAEVYSLNIDYRDVAEKVRMLRQRQPEP